MLENEVEITCLASADRFMDGVTIDVHPQWPVLRRFAVSIPLVRSLADKARYADIVHNHSLWSMVNVATGWVVPGKRAKLVVSPRGTLSAWALSRSKWVKWLLWPLQRRILAKADLLHATSKAELADIRALGFTAPVVVIPNGIDLPGTDEEAASGSPAFRTLLFLGRIHPTKCVDRLLHAWKTLQDRHAGWQLMIVGGGDPQYVRQIVALAASLGLKRVEFAGPLYGAEKTRAYRAAELFVLPSHSENFGMAVAEALAHGCPAIVSQGAPWAGLEVEGCGWWVKHDVESLARTLDTAMSQPAARLACMGRKGRDWVARDFAWETVAQRMEAAYQWVVHGGDLPDDLHLGQACRGN
jgi:glycosyltransferase involved in cell wall biosynthesis